MKRIIVCFNGTWNKLQADEPTNVVLTALAVKKTASDDTKQIVFYSDGVGSGQNSIWPRLDKILGGGLGLGTFKNIQKVYAQLVMAYEPGDEIFVFGFSRGAFAARSFVGLIRTSGILRPDKIEQFDRAVQIYKNPKLKADSETAFKFRAENSLPMLVSKNVIGRYQSTEKTAQFVNIRYVGLWDTVPSLGVLNTLFGNKSIVFRFHDHDLSSLVQSARHAVAADEKRTTFRPLTWTNTKVLESRTGDKGLFRQEWFPGDHGSVGGGGNVTGLSSIALSWVWDGAIAQGLELYPDAIKKTARRHNPFAPLKNQSASKFSLTNLILRLLTKSRKEKASLVDDSKCLIERKSGSDYSPDAYG